MPYVRTVKTASGATAVQVVHSLPRGSRDIEHIGSAHDEAELEALKAAARQGMAGGQGVLDLGLVPAVQAAGGGPLPITSSWMGHLADALERAYRVLGLEGAAGGDEVFRQLVLARIIEPSSKLDSLRVLEEAGLSRPSYATLSGACLNMPGMSGVRGSRPLARRMPGWGRAAWCSTTCPRCTSRPTGATGSAIRDEDHRRPLPGEPVAEGAPGRGHPDGHVFTQR